MAGLVFLKKTKAKKVKLFGGVVFLLTWFCVSGDFLFLALLKELFGDFFLGFLSWIF